MAPPIPSRNDWPSTTGSELYMVPDGPTDTGLLFLILAAPNHLANDQPPKLREQARDWRRVVDTGFWQFPGPFPARRPDAR